MELAESIHAALEKFIKNNLNDLCASIQQSLVKMLLKKLKKASRDTRIDQIAIAGGVSANNGLREALQQTAEKENWDIFIPKHEYCTDNAAMIAMAGYFKFKAGEFSDLSVTPDARLRF